MSHNEGAGLAELEETVLQQGADADEAVLELLSRIDDEDHDTYRAVKKLKTVSEEVPEALVDHVERLSSTLYHADDTDLRYWLAKILRDLVDEVPETGEDAARGLSEATRVRTERIDAETGYEEVRTVRSGLDGWITLGDDGHEIPPAVVENAVKVINIADASTLISAIKTLGKALEAGSSRKDLALRGLLDIADTEDELTRRHATEALARAVVADSVHSDREEIHRLLVENQGVAQDDVVDTAIARLETGEE